MVSAADDFEAVFVIEAGVERRLPDVVDELGDRFGRSRRIAVNATSAGWYWSSTLGRLVGFESPPIVLNSGDNVTVVYES